MPELPEVEIARRYVTRHALDRRIEAVRVLDRRIVRGTTERALKRQLRGRRFLSTRRHGKHLFVEVDGADWLYLHFGMTGDLHVYSGDDLPRFSRVVFDFPEDHHLAFEDARLFGSVSLIADPDRFISARPLGPDPLDPSFTLPLFRHVLGRRKGAIKAVLMSQSVIAGLGNLYADEALFQASIHPTRSTARLSDVEVRILFGAIRRILRIVIERREADRELPRSFLIDRRTKGEPCPKCGGEIDRCVVAGRTTCFCARHQQ